MNGSAAWLQGQRWVIAAQIPLLPVQSQRGTCICTEHVRAPKTVPLQTAFTLMPNRLRNSNEDIFLANITHMVLPLGIKPLQHLFFWYTFDLLPVVCTSKTSLCRSHSALVHVSFCPDVMRHSALTQVMFCPGPGLILPRSPALILLPSARTCFPALLCLNGQLADCLSVWQDLAPGQGVQLDEVEGGNDELKENPASSRNPKEGLPKVCIQSLVSSCSHQKVSDTFTL